MLSLLCVVFGRSLVKKLVINLSDVVFNNGDVVCNTAAVNIFGDEFAVIVGKAVLLADTPAIVLFSMGIAPFMVEIGRGVWYNEVIDKLEVVEESY